MSDDRDRRTRDRTARLVSFGAIAVLVGVAAIAISFLEVIEMLVASSGMVSGLESDPRSAVTGALVYACLGASFVAAGIGSIRRRRWAPPVLRVLSLAWLVGGLLSLPLLPRIVEQSLDIVAGDPTLVTAGAARVALGLAMAATVLFGVLLPAAFVWAYHGRDVEWTCREHQASASWTDGRTASILGLSLGFGAFGLLALLGALRPAVPLFGTLVAGLPGAGLLVLTAAACGWLAVATYRRRRAAWWAALSLLTAAGVSSAVTLYRVPLATWYAAIGYPPGILPADDGFRSVLLWSTVALTVVTIGYMLAVRRQFDA